MKNVKRLLALLLAGILCLSLAGCGEQQEAFTAESLTVWIWDGGQQEAWQTIADGWTAGTGIEVTVVAKDKASYWRDLESGLSPDLLWVDGEHLYAGLREGRFLGLDERLKGSSIKLSDYDSQVTASFQEGDVTYAIPRAGSVMALWYNKVLFDNGRTAYPDESWTWEKLAQEAAKLTSRHNGTFGIAMDTADTADGWYNLVYAYGGSILTEDEEGNTVSGWSSAGTAEAMALLSDLICNAMPSQPTMSQVGSYELFAGGNTAMLILSGEEAMSLIREPGAENWACTLLPYCDRNGNGACDEGERASMLSGSGWAISSMTEDPAASFSLLETLCSQESQQTMAEGSLSQPAMTSLAESWCSSIVGWDFTPYTKTLSGSALYTAPTQTSAESWLDYAAEHTLRVAWNDPSRMSEMLQTQHAYTQSDLAREALPAQPEAGEESPAELPNEDPGQGEEAPAE